MDQRQPQLIEQTGKGYKCFMVLGCVSIVLGVMTCSGSGGDPEILDVSMSLFWGGVVVAGGAKLLAWWNHG
jgi:hypothetical protein